MPLTFRDALLVLERFHFLSSELGFMGFMGIMGFAGVGCLGGLLADGDGDLDLSSSLEKIKEII